MLSEPTPPPVAPSVSNSHSLLTAPYDDEPVSPELERRILEAAAEVDAGAKGYTTEELNRELGL